MKMNIKILGSGCSNCAKMEKVAREAIKELGIEAEVKKVEDMSMIMSYGVMSTPALVIDEQVKLVGKVPNMAKMMEIIQQSFSR
jgi:small redox-active disulfide protein 2